MIDHDTEQLVHFADAPQVIPGRPHLSQVYRWAQRGLRGQRLEWLRIGGKRFTSREALGRFFARVTIAAGGSVEPAKPNAPTTKTRRRQIAAAEAELVGAGFEIGGAV